MNNLKKNLGVLLSVSLLMNFVGCTNQKGVSSGEAPTPNGDAGVQTEVDETTTVEELTDLPFDNSKPEYVVAYFVNKLTSLNDFEGYDTMDIIQDYNAIVTPKFDVNDMIIPSKIKGWGIATKNDMGKLESINENIENIVISSIEDIKDLDIKNYSNDNFTIYLKNTPEENEYNTYDYYVIYNISESELFFQVSVTETDENSNCFLANCENLNGQLSKVISSTSGGTIDKPTGGTKADLIKQWEDEGNVVKVSLDEFMTE